MDLNVLNGLHKFGMHGKKYGFKCSSINLACMEKIWV